MKSNSLSAVQQRRDVARQRLLENRRRNAARTAVVAKAAEKSENLSSRA
jgi:hypothetical protein